MLVTETGSDQSPPAPLPAEPSKPQDQQGTRTNYPPEPPYGVKLLWEEFKLTQDKIDRIGDFHFRVRTWAITLSTALVVAGVANKVPWWAYLATLPLIVAFNLIDRAQTKWQGALSARARHLEKELRGRGLDGPRIAQYLDDCRRELEEEWFGRRIVGNGRVFYVTMYTLVLVAIVLAWRDTPAKPPTAEPSAAAPSTPPATTPAPTAAPPLNTPPATPAAPPSTPAAPPIAAPPAAAPPAAAPPAAAPPAAAPPDAPAAPTPPPDAPPATPPAAVSPVAP
jgi:hypothetical protein